MLRFQSSYFRLKTVFQFFEKGLRFSENLFRSRSIENVQNFPLPSFYFNKFLYLIDWNIFFPVIIVKKKYRLNQNLKVNSKKNFRGFKNFECEFK